MCERRRVAKKTKQVKFRFKMQGNAVVFIDWANVYKWKEKLGKDVDLTRLVKYLEGYDEVGEVRFYFGTEEQPHSKIQLREARAAGCKVVTKPVKFLPKEAESGEMVWVRKCDFDLEIGLDAFEGLEKYESFVFFSGDGDFATLYKRLVKRGKQVVVVYVHGSLGREVWEIKQGVFKRAIDRLDVNVFKKLDRKRADKKMPPRRRRRAQ